MKHLHSINRNGGSHEILRRVKHKYRDTLVAVRCDSCKTFNGICEILFCSCFFFCYYCWCYCCCAREQHIKWEETLGKNNLSTVNQTVCVCVSDLGLKINRWYLYSSSIKKHLRRQIALQKRIKKIIKKAVDAVDQSLKF